MIGQLPPEAKAVIEHRVAELGCPAVYPEPATMKQNAQELEGEGRKGKGERRDGVKDSPSPHLPIPPFPHSPVTPTSFPHWVESQGIRYPLPLPGEIQLHNSALAIAALQILRQQGWKISDGAIADGMAKNPMARPPAMVHLAWAQNSD
ncbi:hypothetical protein [Leptothermofonsia sp. ETS-13]|uniref:hypothetical protein n=1 Tax=Leptothermofonsia sp. ETS-13 TaxID=3035696 RepID=UPI003BA0B459